MHTIIHPLKPPRRRPREAERFTSPRFETLDQAGALTLAVYVPGVEALGVEITFRGPDLIVVARKSRVVRVNWSALQLESVQHDYRLKLRLGHGFAVDALRAELSDGVLKITLPHRSGAAVADARVA